MNILDIAENSVHAGAGLVEIALAQNDEQGALLLTIRDDGHGMDAATLARATDPFCTSRTTRRVGLGLPFLKMAAEMTGGAFSIQSAPGAGTTVSARFTLGHIDLAPLGDLPGTIMALVQTSPDIDFVLRCEVNGKAFVFDTREARAVLGEDVPLSEPAVALFVRDYVAEGMATLQEEPPTIPDTR